MSRPTKEHSKKIIFQRVGIRFETYLRLKKITEEAKKIHKDETMSTVIDKGIELVEQYYLHKK